MKKIIILFVAMILCGCAQEKQVKEKSQYKDGTYTR